VLGERGTMSFNHAQLQAIHHFEGACMVLAGPGSGKTTVITQRTKTLIQKYGVQPSEILVITFTKAAAMEMQERFFQLMGKEQPPVTFGTFHAVYFKILKCAYGLSAASIITEEQKIQWLKELIEQERFELEDKEELIHSMLGEISQVKGERILPKQYEAKSCSNEVFWRIYTKYQEKLKYSRKIDFDDMLVLTYELLVKRKDILENWQKKYQFILIDEFQDINRIQYDTIRLLAKPQNNLFIVGDDDQSIYQFRGSKPEIMLNFSKDYPETKEILLDWNYRSARNIVNTACQVISHNSKRFPKKIQAFRPEGEKIAVRLYQTPKEESRAILQEMDNYLKKGFSYSDIAILFRTNTDARYLAEQCLEYQIPFHMKEVIPNLFEHWMVKDLLAYIQIALGSRSRSDFLQIINRPKRYISRECLDCPEISFERLNTFYQEKDWMQKRILKLEQDITFLKDLSPYAAITYIRKGIGYEDYIKEYAQYRHIHTQELFDILDEIQESAEEYFTYQEWFAHMEQYKEELKRQEREAKDGQKRDEIEMMTLHRSKGLEYKVVFMIDAVEGIIPHQKAVMEEEIEEERRMFYVGMTRAKELLHIYAVKERYHKPVAVSRFLLETGIELEERDKIQ